MSTYTVTLEALPNPDFRPESHAGSVDIELREVIVTSLGEAVTACGRFIDANGLGGGNWTGGSVRRDGEEVARISYNGRIWPAGQYKPGAEEIDSSTALGAL